MKTIFLDTCSGILLFKAGLLDLLLSHYWVKVALTVLDELTRPGYPGAMAFSAAAADGRMEKACPPAIPLDRFPGLSGLDKGERDTILLYLEKNTGFVATDDGKGAAWLKKNRLPYVSAVLFPKILVTAGLLPVQTGAEKTARLIRLGRYSRKILDIAQTCPPEVLTPFLP